MEVLYLVDTTNKKWKIKREDLSKCEWIPAALQWVSVNGLITDLKAEDRKRNAWERKRNGENESKNKLRWEGRPKWGILHLIPWEGNDIPNCAGVSGTLACLVTGHDGLSVSSFNAAVLASLPMASACVYQRSKWLWLFSFGVKN